MDLGTELAEAKRYFDDRADELLAMCGMGNAWVFVCAAAMVEYLVKLVTGGKAGRGHYIAFVDRYMAQTRAEYRNFTYVSGAQDLPTQMYVILRCGIVHSFSLIPDGAATDNGGRPRAIVLAHRAEGQPHLSSFASPNAPDAACFVAEDFIEDIKTTAGIIFYAAATDTALRANIETQWRNHPPIQARI
ncbi:MAG TPA: hypothetical protein VMV40_04965 [Acidiferrobacter sp.]|nr:hypothetical protein [Acidiferrobacter sp.]